MHWEKFAYLLIFSAWHTKPRTIQFSKFSIKFWILVGMRLTNFKYFCIKFQCYTNVVRGSHASSYLASHRGMLFQNFYSNATSKVKFSIIRKLCIVSWKLDKIFFFQDSYFFSIFSGVDGNTDTHVNWKNYQFFLFWMVSSCAIQLE